MFVLRILVISLNLLQALLLVMEFLFLIRRLSLQFQDVVV
jgi:hypothetical protein